MANRFANGAKAFGFCDYCNFRFPLKKLKNEVVKTKQTQIRACPQCWSMDHPQLLLGTFPVSDPQAIRDPRPDTNTWYQSGTNGLQTAPTTGTGPLQEGFPGEGMLVIQWGWNPIGGSQDFDAALTPNTLVGVGEVGAVTIGNTGTPQFTLVEALYTTPGTYSWTAPAGVTSIYVLCVGGGGSGSAAAVATSSSFSTFFAGAGANSSGSNGGAGGTGTSLGFNIYGGNGGAGSMAAFSSPGGGGGAGGYAGNGGNGSNSNSVSPGGAGSGGGGGGGRSGIVTGSGGGGVGLNGPGASGANSGISGFGSPGFGGSGGQNANVARGGLYGGGGASVYNSGGARGAGGGGGLRWTPDFVVVPQFTYAVVVGQGGNPAGTNSGAGGAVKIAYWLPVP